MKDPIKIQNKLAQLGSGWIEADGYHALTKMEYFKEQPEASVFNPASGIPLKTFVNPNTGEIKIFLAAVFEK
jgi:hypothetical protein